MLDLVAVLFFFTSFLLSLWYVHAADCLKGSRK